MPGRVLPPESLIFGEGRTVSFTSLYSIFNMKPSNFNRHIMIYQIMRLIDDAID